MPNLVLSAIMLPSCGCRDKNCTPCGQCHFWRRWQIKLNLSSRWMQKLWF